MNLLVSASFPNVQHLTKACQHMCMKILWTSAVQSYHPIPMSSFLPIAGSDFPNAAMVSPGSSPKCDIASPFFIEICAGSARVTSCLQHLGLATSFGVDHKLQRNAGRVLVADLTSQDGQALGNLWLSSPNLAGVFIAPPCGTCSRARGIPVKLPNGKVVQGPQPLRSDLQPNGLSELSWINRQCVSSANKLYHYVTSVALNCIQRNLIVCIENLRSSLYWKTTFFQPLVKHLTFTAHQAFAYGSLRPKCIVLAHNTHTLHSLNQVCPGEGPGHYHKPWGVVGPSRTFSTSEETAYVGISHCLPPCHGTCEAGLVSTLF